jgi:hypothetical protein
VGLLCAALGAAKGSAAEAEWLSKLATLRMTVVTIPRSRMATFERTREGELPLRRLEDFHTVGGGYDADTAWQSMPRSCFGTK